MLPQVIHSSIGSTLQSPKLMDKLRTVQPIMMKPQVKQSVETTKEIVKRLLPR